MHGISVSKNSITQHSCGQTAEVSVVIPTMNRTDVLLRTIGRILACEPPPDEVLTYVDNGDTSSAEAMRRQFRSVNVLEGSQRIGPGGGRNLLLTAARNEIVACFDDDSFPLDPGYFRRVAATFALNPNAAVVATHIYHRGELIADARDVRVLTADFVGCGCAFRKSAFETVGGFVPLPLAYGMEESDFALRAHAAGYEIVLDAALRVCHDTDLAHHDSPEVTAASVKNLALLAYLRYPPILWLLGAAQVARRVIWLIAHRRLRGLMTGLLAIPGHFRRYRTYRRTVRAQDVKAWLAARRRGASAVKFDAI